jgi:hypothetical protein
MYLAAPKCIWLLPNVSSCSQIYLAAPKCIYLLPNVSISILIPALVLSHIDYACAVWLKPNLVSDIDILIKRRARFAFGLAKYDSVSDLICDNLMWVLSKYSLTNNILKLSHKIVDGTAPPFLVTI